MKKSILCACLATILLSGCARTATTSQTQSASGSQNTVSTSSVPVKEPPKFTLEGNAIKSGRQNLYNMNFVELQGLLEKAVTGEKNNVSMPAMSQLPAADIYFLPNGEIVQFNMALRPVRETINEFIADQYKIECNASSDITDTSGDMLFDIYFVDKEKDRHFLKESFAENFDYSKFPNFMSWASDFDFETVIQTYIEDEPLMYEFVAGIKSLQRALIDDENISCIYLDCSSGVPVRVEEANLPYSEPGIYPFTPLYETDDGLKKIEYYAILPHYLSEQTAGYSPALVCAPPMDSGNEDCFYSSRAKAIKSNKYAINNAIILFPNGFEPVGD